MKKILNLLFALVVFNSCLAQKEKLELNLEKGQIYYRNQAANISINQEINGQIIPFSSMSINGKASYKVIDINNSTYDLEVKYEILSLKTKLPNRLVEYNSEKKDVTDIFSTILGEMKNKPFYIKMTKSGKIIEVKNLENIFSGVFDKFPKLTDVQKQQIQEQIKQSYGEKTFKASFETASVIYSDSLVSKGDKWTIETPFESGKIIANKTTTYELKENNEQFYLISADSKIESLNKEYQVGKNLKMKDFNGTTISNFKINRKSGWIIEASINQIVKSVAQIGDNSNSSGIKIIPMTMNDQLTITEK